MCSEGAGRLTMAELREMDGEPAWCREYQCWGIVAVNSWGPWKDVPFFEFRRDQTGYAHNIAEHGLTLCREKPKEAENV